MENKIINKKASMSYLQIFILFLSSFAFAYLIGGSVDAQIEGYSCCEETNDGLFCEYVPKEQCNSDFRISPNKCDDAVFCGEIGCCISPENSFCNENVFEKTCDGNWADDKSCNVQECKKGCCILGNQARWINEKQCEFESGDFSFDFRGDIESEVECIFLTEKNDEGACIFDLGNEKKCIFTTRGDCILKCSEDNFYKDIFCSDSILNTDCGEKNYKGCLENEESVYWFDSCNNRESVAESCSVLDGTICRKEEGEYGCKDLSCVDENNNKRKNGESWCEYEGTIGDGKDVVGSRHIKEICFMGEIKKEPCADYRNQICVQSDIKLNDGKLFSEASCRINNWRSCLEYNTGDSEDMSKKCQENPDCFVNEINIGGGFNFCSPNYPPGFDLSKPSSRASAELVCNFASLNCNVICEKKFSQFEFKWVCQNEFCETEEFTRRMNDFCVNLGDCGAYVNYKGGLNDEGYSVINGRRLTMSSLSLFKEFAKYKSNQKPVEPGDLSFLGVLGKPDTIEGEIDEDISDFEKGLFGVTGALGAPALLSLIGSIEGLGFLEPVSGRLSKIYQDVPGLGSSISIGFMDAAAGAFAGAALGKIAIKVWSLDGKQARTITEIAGSFSMIFLMGAGFDFTGSLLITAVILTTLVSILRWIGLGEHKTKVVEFKCLPWQPYNGGDDCTKCNEDDFCTEYKCESLGKTCELIGKGTENQICINNPIDSSTPKIEPLYENISEGYKYLNVKNEGFELAKEDGKCLDAFDPVEFGIKTDRPAVCKIDVDPLKRYDEMDEFFSNVYGNFPLINHTRILLVPSVESFANQYNLTEEQIKKIGDINFYIKCANLNGDFNEAPYVIKTCVNPTPDLTAPRILRTIPGEKAYAKYGSKEKDLKVYVNEPAECKWSFDDKDYESMENSMECHTDLGNYSLYGWMCDTVLDINTNNKFNIKCEDISDNKNKMTESYEFEVSYSNSDLMISDFRPIVDSEILSGVEPAKVDLKIETSGGAEDQSDTICEWQGNGYSDLFRLSEDNVYVYEFTSLSEGRYNINFKCEDIAGNIAESSTSFRVKIDNNGPKIIRVYGKDDRLKIITNEPAECRYDFNKDFIFENASIMSNNGNEHSVDWSFRTFYIQCKDDFDNKGRRIDIKTYK